MKVQILAPEKIIYQGEIFSLYACGLNGFFQLLNNHAPMISILKEGKISLCKLDFKKKKYLHFLIKKGFLEVKYNNVTIMTD